MTSPSPLEIRRPGSEQVMRRIDPWQKAAIRFFSATFAFEHDIVPLRFENGVITVEISEKRDDEQTLIQEIARLTKIDPSRIALRRQSIQKIRESLKIIYPQEAEAPSDASRLWRAALNEAVLRGASDIYVEPHEDGGRIRLKVDDIMVPCEAVAPMQRKNLDLLTGFIRTNASVQPSNDRLPGAGRMTAVVDGPEIDLRVSTIPMGQHATGINQRICVRLLNLNARLLDLRELGMSEELLKELMEEIESPVFFIVIVGPTGAGKSTLASAIVHQLDRETKNVMSVENPIEQRILDVAQISIDVDEAQAEERKQLSFAEAMRTLLRQNPDVVYLGEINNEETMTEAKRAANTGIPLVSTLHCVSAINIVERMKELGANQYAIAATLTMATSQRLLNRLCLNCREKMSNLNQLDLRTRSIAERFDIELKTVYIARKGGCDVCHHTGHSGRIGAFELLKVNQDIKAAIAEGATIVRLLETALDGGFRPMVVSGIEHLAAGLVSEQSIKRKLHYDEAMVAVKLANSEAVL